MRSFLLDLLCLAIPLFSFFTLKVIGSLPGGELLTLALLIPCVAMGWRRIWRGYNKPILTLMGLWLLSQIVTDFYRQSPFTNMAKGQALIVFFGIDLIVLSALAYKRERRIIFYAIGQVIGTFLNYELFGGYMGTSTGTWKFGYSTFVIPAVMLISCIFYARKSYILAEIFIFGLAALNLALNYRSPALFIAIAGILVIPSFSVGRSLKPHWVQRPATDAVGVFSNALKSRTVILLVLTAIAGLGVSKVYAYLASSEALGYDAKVKYEMQSRGKFGLLVGGRPETLVSWRAVLDSPILGHGSWAEDQKYTEMLQDVQTEAGYVDEDVYFNEKEELNVIPSHSYLMGAWVFSGLLGAVFWVYILYLVGLAVLKIANITTALSPYFAYLALKSLWDILFSPFGQDGRLQTAFLLVIVCTILERAPQAASVAPRAWQAGRNLLPARDRMLPRFPVKPGY